MMEPPAGARIWIAAGITDLRRGFTGLSAAVQTVLEQDPFGGQVFVFRGRRGEQARFRIPIGLCGYRVSMASSLRKAIATVSTHTGSRWRAKPRVVAVSANEYCRHPCFELRTVLLPRRSAESRAGLAQKKVGMLASDRNDICCLLRTTKSNESRHARRSSQPEAPLSDWLQPSGPPQQRQLLRPVNFLFHRNVTAPFRAFEDEPIDMA
jgi:hypothetical protein